MHDAQSHITEKPQVLPQAEFGGDDVRASPLGLIQ